MAEEKRQLKVFLCHAHSDKGTVRELYLRLIKDGVDAWLDKEKLLPGQDWELEIRRAVRAADVVVVCLSRQFNQAGFRQKEVRLALETAMEQPEGEIFIIPARLEECDTLESLRKWHWVDLFEEDGYERLMRALRIRADKIGATLQLKKGWLPRVNPPRQTDEPVIEKRQEKDIVEKFGDEKSQPEKPRSPRKLNTATIAALTGLAGVVIVALLGSSLAEKWFSPNPQVSPTEPQQVVNVLETNNSLPLPETPAVTQGLTSTGPASPLTTEITTANGVEMILVPAGEFIMGSNTSASDEQPAHRVYLDAFYIDKYEVTNVLYKACVDMDVCDPPIRTDSETRPSYYDNSEFDHYPVVYVDWDMARTYCEWRDAQLPTEAQWEKAARGEDGRVFPWGNDFNGSFANSCDKNCPLDWADQGYDDGYPDTAPVGSYQDGISPYGVYDLAGNVWEWVADLYNGNYYASAESDNPTGPNFGEFHTLHGGSWDNDMDGIRASNRTKALGDSDNPNFGFRCAMDANP